MIEGILIEGLIYGIMVLSVFITFRILDFADMTVDGSFPLGAAVLAVLMVKGCNPALALLASFGAGSVAGLVTSLIHVKLKIPGLLAGILTMTMMFSVNLRIMSDRANVSLLKVSTLFTRISDWASQFMDGQTAVLIFLVFVVVGIMILLDVFFHTDFGLTLGALGSNPQMIISQGINPAIIKTVGICLSNGLVGIAGALAAMYQGFADINGGSGVVVSGLASLMIGEFLVRSNRISVLTLRAVLGSIIYRALMYGARSYGYHIKMRPSDLRLVTGILIILCLILSHYDVWGRIQCWIRQRGEHDKA